MVKKSILISLLLSIALVVNSQSLCKKLKSAYRDKSEEKLEDILNEWNNLKFEVPSNDTSELIGEVIKYFYFPNSLNEYDSIEDKYVVIKPKIEIKFFETLNLDTVNYIESYSNDTVNLLKIKEEQGKERYERYRSSFYSALSMDKDYKKIELYVADSPYKVLYLTDSIRNNLEKFLGNKKVPFARWNIMSPARSKGKSGRRQEFLNKYLQVIYGHWGNYWHLEAQPFVYRIAIDDNFETAVLFFQKGYQGGYAKYLKKESEWKLDFFEFTWIE